MKLYTVALAPNPTKVMLYLAERAQVGQALPVEQITVNTLKGRQKEPEHLARNPFGTLPVLEFAEGRYLTESLPIIDYLEAKFPDGALGLPDLEQRALDRDIERVYEMRIALPISDYVHATASPLGWPASPERASYAKDSLPVGLDNLEQRLSDGRRFICGDHVSVADLTLASVFQLARFIKADLVGDRPHILGWDKLFRERPAAQSVLKW